MNVLSEARAAYQAGLVVLPCLNDGSKRPALESWKQYKTTPPTSEELRSFNFANQAGFGMIAGPVSGHVLALDIDGSDTWKLLMDAAIAGGVDDLLDRIAGGYADVTPAGGRRLLVRYPSSWQWRDHVLARRPDPIDPKKAIPLVELCTWNILAPSGEHVHPTGKPYRRLCGGFDSIASVSDEELEDLLSTCRALDAMPRRSEARSAGSENGRPGDAFAAATSWGEILEPAGWRCASTSGERTYWTRPGKVSGISASTIEDGPLFVFTSSSTFEPDRAYDKFAAYAYLNHDGDFSSAARALAGQGFGRTSTPYDKNDINDQTPTEEPIGSFMSFKTSRCKPKLSHEALFGVAGRYVKLVDSHTEADPAAVLLQFLLMFGNMVGRTPGAEVMSTRHTLNEHGLIIGPTGFGGRKGGSADITRAVFADVDEAWAKDQIISGLSTGEGLIDAVDKATDKRLLMLETEFARTLRAMGREGNTLSEVIRQCWDSGSLGILTRQRAVMKTAGAHISIIGHATEEDLERYLNATDAANGFANRFIYALAMRSKFLPEPSKWKGDEIRERDEIIAELQQAEVFGRQHSTYTRDTEARSLWNNVYPHLTRERPGLLGVLCGRADAHTLRLSVIYAVLDCSEEVRERHLRAALALWAYSEDSIEYLFGGRLGDRLADHLLAMLRATPDGLTRTQIRDTYSRNKGPVELDRALELLLRLRLVERSIEKTGGPGRPVERWKARAESVREE